jgi:hypothetical protein
VAHLGLPKPAVRLVSKTKLLQGLYDVDSDQASRARVLAMETDFRARIDTMLAALPLADAQFAKFNTSPYVLLFYAAQRGHQRISEIESDIIPAKVFSSMETSAGRMMEVVALPHYGWTPVVSGMHSSNSALDGRMITPTLCKVATLKSGPRCLNDEMSENFADAVISYVVDWATEAERDKVEFTYGVLYGTPKISNKKDWHILRNLAEKLPNAGGAVTKSPNDGWEIAFKLGGIDVTATVRIGTDWWDYLGGPDCAIEVWTALIRACIAPGEVDASLDDYLIQDLASIVSTACVPDHFNVSLLQKSQIPWLFFVARHFCDSLIAGSDMLALG